MRPDRTPDLNGELSGGPCVRTVQQAAPTPGLEQIPSPWGTPRRGRLERDVRLSESMIWGLNRRYFDTEGVRAWSAGHVPSYVTTNARIARADADIAVGFVRDASPCGPVTVVELGAGTGRFAHQFVVALRRQLGDGVRYVMTDFTTANVEAWLRHPRLRTLAEAGVLDAALFDAAEPGALELTWSGEVLDEFPGPLVVIANYVFDSLPVDCFSIEAGRLHATLASVVGPAIGPAGIGDLELAYRPEAVAEAGYYDDPVLDGILEEYTRMLPDGDVLFPVTALRTLRSLAARASGPTLLLAADKGHLDVTGLSGMSEPHLARHAGCFSLMVNFDAISRYVVAAGGIAMRPPHPADHLQVTAFGLGRPPGGWCATARAFDQHVSRFGPDDFFSIRQAMDRHVGELGLNEILAYLALSGNDRDCFLTCYPRLLELAEHADETHRRRLLRAVTELSANDLPIGDTSDLPFCLGVLLQRLRYHPQAIEQLDASLALHGADPRTYVQLAICRYSLHQLEEAGELVAAALELDPDEPTARSMHITISSELADRRSLALT